MMRDVLIAIVQNLPATLAAFGAIVRFGDDDDERLEKLEKVVIELDERLRVIRDEIEAKKLERST